MDLMADAACGAAEDAGAGLRLLEALDTVVVIRSFSDTSWRFACPFGGPSNPPKSLAARLGADRARRLVYTHHGVHMPHWIIRRPCRIAQGGDVEAAPLPGGRRPLPQKAEP